MLTPLRSLSSPAGIAALAVILAGLSAMYAYGSRDDHEQQARQVAYVDFQVVLNESEAGKSLSAQLAPRQKALEQEAQTKLKEFQKQQDELAKQHGSLGETLFNEKSRALQKQFDEWNVHVQQRQHDLNDEANTAVKGIKDILRGQLAAIAEENLYASIQSMDQVLYAQTQFNVTPEAIRRLNKSVTKVTLPGDEKK